VRRLEVLTVGLICCVVISLIVNVVVLMDNQRLRRSYDELYRSYDELDQTYLSTVTPTKISPPISKLEAIYIALEYGGWNETMLKGMEITATLYYMKFDPGYIEYRGAERICHGGVEALYQVTEPVSDYSPVRVEMWYGNVTYRYMWEVVVEQVGPFKSIPPPGLYCVDAATGEVVTYPFLL
jgi:hypothetical protein